MLLHLSMGLIFLLLLFYLLPEKYVCAIVFIPKKVDILHFACIIPMLNSSCRKEVDGVKQDGVFRVKVVFHPEKLIF